VTVVQKMTVSHKMKKISRKERERIARKEAIIDAALAVISEKGFEAATMDEIAETAELGKGTLYLHFKSKTSIYLAICERGSRILNRSMAKVLTLDIKGIDMVEKLGEVYLEFIQNEPVYFIAFNYYENILEDENIEEDEIAKKCEENAHEAMTYIVRALQIGMQDDSIKDIYDPKELGLIIWGASKGVMHIAFLKQKKHHLKVLDEVDFSLQSLIKSFIQLVGTGMKKFD
jgi:TetR/AcrR family transcriptional regulator